MFSWLHDNAIRLVTGMSVEKKQKSQKGKTKTSEGRKQLGSVRVIQRNLVYIVGLPLELADEDVCILSLLHIYLRVSLYNSSSLFFHLEFLTQALFCNQLLQQKEYFGQYGKVLKVSISRTAAGAIQQFANSTCSV